jgi:hypothetical protein
LNPLAERTCFSQVEALPRAAIVKENRLRIERRAGALPLG